MGKSKGGKYPHKPRPRKGAAADEEEGSEEEEFVDKRGLGQQRANVGMLPPSDSEEEEEEGDKKDGEKPKEGADGSKAEDASSSKPAEAKPAAKKAPAKKADDDESSDDDSDSDSDDPTPEYLRAAPPRPKKAPVVEERTEEQIRKDLERLELIRKKREDDRLKRIQTEGWDRYAPVTDTNRPPGTVPSDHPDHKE